MNSVMMGTLLHSMVVTIASSVAIIFVRHAFKVFVLSALLDFIGTELKTVYLFAETEFYSMMSNVTMEFLAKSQAARNVNIPAKQSAHSVNLEFVINANKAGS